MGSRIKIEKRGRGSNWVLARGERRRLRFLGGGAVSLFTFLIVCVFVLSSAQRLLLSSPQVGAVVAAVLVDLANADRVESDLPSLTVNPVLVAAAQAKANDMAEKSYFAHISPQGLDPWHWFREADYRFQYAGENLAIDFADSGDVERAWMASPTHRDNILSENYTEIGIATAQGIYQGRPTTFVVQAFGKPTRAEAAEEETIPFVPETPAVVALRQQASDAQVLGTSEALVATTSPTVAAVLARETEKNMPWWSFALGFPRDTMRYAYYALGLLILLALAFETRLEFHRHHIRHALTAGTLLATMSILFFIADYALFAEPVLAIVSGSA